MVQGEAEAQFESDTSGDPWVAALAVGAYDELSIGQRLAAVARMVDAAAEGVTLRALLEWRLEEVTRARRSTADDARVLFHIYTSHFAAMQATVVS